MPETRMATDVVVARTIWLLFWKKARHFYFFLERLPDFFIVSTTVVLLCVFAYDFLTNLPLLALLATFTRAMISSHLYWS